MSVSTKGPALPNGKAISQSTTRWLVPVLCLVLAAITFAVFGQTLRHEFIDFDDGGDVYENRMVAQGLTLKGFVWAFSVHSSNWFPLTWFSHMLDCQLYGLHPGGHHLTNVLLHTATVILLFLVLRQMTGALWSSAFVAALFAVHPLRVESVAWVAERKDVLSGLFFMLTIAAYVCYANELKGQSSKFKVFYGLTILFFVLGLMSKPMLVTLPLILLLLDYWPLQRMESATRLVMEKLPLLALCAGACAVTLWAQHEGIQSAGTFTLSHRLSNAVVACVVYLGQMVWPARLAVLYPYPQNGLPAWEVTLAVMLVAGLSVVAWATRRMQPWLLVGWVWYLLMLLPVVGIIQVGAQAHADRYTYLPQIGIYVAVTWLIAQWRVSRLAVGGLMAGVIAVLMVCAWRQTAYWQNSETLWARAVACTTANSVAHRHLGTAFREKGRVDEAINQFNAALHINPDDADAHNNLGTVFRQKGKVDQAIAEYEKALQINPALAKAHYNLGIALLQKGKAAEALNEYQKALQIEPANVQVRNNLAWLLATGADASLRNGQKAVELAQQANELSGGSDPSILDTLAAALAEAGRFGDATRTAQKAMELARAAGQQNLVKELDGELKRYEAGLPCRE
jgi:tetratricopeptide (TPR) repeat protein